MINPGDPVGIGLVAGLAQPAGNVTGTAFDVGLATLAPAVQPLAPTDVLRHAAFARG
jgi:hypothetical protein